MALSLLADVAVRKQNNECLSHAILCRNKYCNYKRCSDMKRFIHQILSDSHENMCKAKVCRQCDNNKVMRKVIVNHIHKYRRQGFIGKQISRDHLFEQFKRVAPDNLHCVIDDMQQKVRDQSMTIGEVIRKLHKLLGEDNCNRVRAVYLLNC